jgi:uncharacterized membrane protein
MTKRIGGFVIHVVILLIFFLWVVDALFLFRGKLFQLELIAFFGLVTLSVLGMMNYLHKQPELLRATYGIGLLNTLALSVIAWDLLVVSLIASVGGLFFSFRQQRKPEQWGSHHDDMRVEEIVTERAVEGDLGKTVFDDVDTLHIEPLESMIAPKVRSSKQTLQKSSKKSRKMTKAREMPTQTTRKRTKAARKKK